MRSELTFVATLFALVVVTWLVIGRRRLPAPRVPFANPRREALLALIPAAALFVLASAMFIGVTARDRSAESQTDNRAVPYTFKQAAGQLATNGIILVPFLVMLRVRRQGLETVGISRHNLAPAWLIGGLSCIAAAAINGKANGDFWLQQGTLWRVVGQAGVGVSEEAIFRGYLQLRWAAWLNRSGWIAVAGICTLWHIPVTLASNGTDVAAVGTDLLTILAAALAFGLSMKLTENIAGLSIVHAILNVVSDV